MGPKRSGQGREGRESDRVAGVDRHVGCHGLTDAVLVGRGSPKIDIVMHLVTERNVASSSANLLFNVTHLVCRQLLVLLVVDHEFVLCARLVLCRPGCAQKTMSAP